MLRVREPEIMDDAGLDRDDHFRALEGLASINSWTGSAQVLWMPIRALCLSRRLKSLRLLDIATGGGDLPIALWQKAKAAGIDLEITACDISSPALDFAQRQAARAGVPLRFLTCDVLQDEIPGEYDVVISSLFMHHLDPEQVELLLKKMAHACRGQILISDLYRSYFNMFLVYLATRLWSNSPIVRSDGLTSIKAAYTCREMQEIALKAGLAEACIQTCFPGRWLLKWDKP